MYEQLLCHLVSDYWLQNDWMALNKKKNFFVALLHGFIYTLPFLLLTNSTTALLVIWLSHAFIDHTDVVCFLNRIKNWNFRTVDGFAVNRPPFITIWLLIIQDNILHLCINYICLKWL